MKTHQEIHEAIDVVAKDPSRDGAELDIIAILHALNDRILYVHNQASGNHADHLVRRLELEADMKEMKYQLDDLNQTHT